MRIIAFVDQVKAYELLSHEWLRTCWALLPMPTWVHRWLHIITLNRHVRIRTRGFTGPLIPLVKGLGMGGPHAPLQWSVGFDPIVWILDVVAKAHLTTVYADDTCLAAMNMSCIVKAQALLLTANLVAGLMVARHHCITVRVTLPFSRCLSPLAFLKEKIIHFCASQPQLFHSVLIQPEDSDPSPPRLPPPTSPLPTGASTSTPPLRSP